jgi:hypothetical protein
VLRRAGLKRYARATRYSSLLAAFLPLVLTFVAGRLAERDLLVLFMVATFYGVACYSMRSKWIGYASALLYNTFLWLLWGRFGWQFADHTQFYLIPVGLSAILFAETSRKTLGREAVNAIRGVGLILVYVSLAVPIWQFASFGSWVALLLVSLLGIFAGIGLRVQVFLWLGLVGFVLDVVYQLGRMGLEHTLAKVAIMLVLGVSLVLFVALNEKKRIVARMRKFYDTARGWE